MAALTPYFAQTSADRVKQRLKPAVAEAVDKIIQRLDPREHRANVAALLEALFPLAAKASANASLNRVVHEFNDAAQEAGLQVKMEVTAAKSVGAAARWVWFEGPAPGPGGVYTPDLNAVGSERLLEQRGMPLGPVVVLLTVNEHETAAVLRVFAGDQTPPTQTVRGVTYNLLGQVAGVRVVHALCEMGSGGVGASQSRTRDVIEAWAPSAVIAVGVAFGMNEKKQRLGDVLVSTHVRPYELSRVNAGGSLTLRGARPDASRALLNRIRHLDQSLSSADRAAWPRLHFGVVLSGEKLVDDLDYRESLRPLELEAVGGEMEGSGLYVSAHEARVDWIVVKAICDWADGNKGVDKARRQIQAAENAARVVRRALEGPGLFDDVPRPGPDRGGRPLVGDGPRPGIVPAASRMGLRDFEDVADRLEHDTLGCLTSLYKDRPEDVSTGEAGQVEVLGYILEWIRQPGGQPLFALLGEYGMGKTITCQRLARELDSRRQEEPGLPVPLYFDLRHVTGLRDGVPGLSVVVEQCVRAGWHSLDESFGVREFERLVDQGALVIFDGLDEVLVKLSEADGQEFTNQLIKLLSDSKARRARAGLEGPSPRLLISCRTQYFRTLRDQRTHFTGQERGEHGPEACRALVLLPFGEAQVRRYLSVALPEADIDRLVELVRSVHDLSELSRRPYTLRLVAEFIPEIEADRAAGRVVNAVSLYRRMARRWLDRDKGKHHLLPDHKMRLAAALAGELQRRGGGLLPVAELEAWFHSWLEGQGDLKIRYSRLPPDQLEEDLRTATFLTRLDGQDDASSGFRFAHTSMHEFFLAEFLFDALRRDQPERWTLPRPSVETLDFLGQMLVEAGGVGGPLVVLQGWRHTYRERVSELLVAYAQRALEKGWPVPVLHGIDLGGARLRGAQIGVEGRELELGPTSLAGADLREARLMGLRLKGADLRGARLERAMVEGCNLEGADLEGANATATEFRRCRLEGSRWRGAETWRTRFIFGAPEVVPVGALVAPRQDGRPEQSRLVMREKANYLSIGGVFSPDDSLVVVVAAGGQLSIWDVASGDRLRTVGTVAGQLQDLMFSEDGSVLNSVQSNAEVSSWDVRAGGCLYRFSAVDGEPMAFAFSRDGHRLVSGGRDGRVRTWDVRRGACVRVLDGHGAPAVACGFAPDGARVVSVAKDGELVVWGADGQMRLKILTGRPVERARCGFTMDGRWVFCVVDGRMSLWDARTGVSNAAWLDGMPCGSTWALSPDGAWVVSMIDSGDLLRLAVEAGGAEVIRKVNDLRPLGLAVSHSGRQCLLAQLGELCLWDVASSQRTWQAPLEPPRLPVCRATPDGEVVIAAGGRSCTVWDVRGGRRVSSLVVEPGASIRAISEGNGWILTVGGGEPARLWDATSGLVVRTIAGLPPVVWGGAVSSDGERVLVCGFAQEGAQLWDTQRAVLLGTFEKTHKMPLKMSFSRDGGRVVVSDFMGDSSILNTSMDLPPSAPPLVLPGVLAASFSADGSRVAGVLGDGTIQIWDAASGVELCSLKGTHDGADTLCYSADGTRLLSAGRDGTLRLWDVGTLECLRVIDAEMEFLGACAFTADGAGLLSLRSDGALSLFDAETGECLRIHLARDGEYAVWEPATSRIIDASPGASRILQWQVFDDVHGWMPVPLESFPAEPQPPSRA